MEVKIEPRKQTDRGGYLMMPLRRNVPTPRNKDWKLVRCPACGAECWDTGNLPAGWVTPQKLCTMCALRWESAERRRRRDGQRREERIFVEI